ncbi:BBE domain-containing protein [Streptomyces roseicoloratus]|uniref:BBE domain-containing protein n=1 Tax=Streptomyces roseicoloratus TaxID=2508722 RepID=UPI0013E93F26|nr:BBE domain-containing protein [Streptomyces roseicoloratus]
MYERSAWRDTYEQLPAADRQGPLKQTTSTGGNHVAFPLTEDGAERTADAYSGTCERLRRLKAEFDPDHVFRVDRNIPPAG